MYEQIVGILREEILQKRVPPDGCLGTHKELAEKYDVSLITIRKALQVLEAQGIVEIKQGKGTFVSRNLLANRHNFFTSYVDVLYGADNDEQNTKLLSLGVIDTPRHLSYHLRSLLGERCFYMERLHSLDGKATGYVTAYLPKKYGDMISPADARANTTYQLYAEKLGIELGKGFQRLRAISADDRLAEIFRLEPGMPMIAIERESYGVDGDFLELMEMYCEYSQYEYTISID
jgi:GntR family transcriptional regulator